MSETILDTLYAKYNFTTLIEWQGRVKYTNMELISRASYEQHRGSSTLLTSLQSIVGLLPEYLQSTNFREIEYYTFKEYKYDATTDSGTSTNLVVIPGIFITNMVAVDESTQPVITIAAESRDEYNLVTAVLRDLNVRFSVAD